MIYIKISDRSSYYRGFDLRKMESVSQHVKKNVDIM